MAYHVIRGDILLIARIFPRAFGARKNTTQLAKYQRVLYVKPSNKMCTMRVHKNYSDTEQKHAKSILRPCR